MTTPPKIRAESGYKQIRISKKAHRELLMRAMKERRTVVAQLDVILGV